MRTLVLAYADGYKWITLAPFIRSLRASGYQGDIVFFLASHSIATARQLSHYHVIPVTIGNRFPWGLPSPSLGLDATHLDACSPHIKRYGAYRLYLEQVAARYDMILLADVKDIVFQANPFAYDGIQSASISFFEEDATTSLGQCPANSRWIQDAFGRHALERLSHYPVLCSGTTLGGSEAIVQYCARMLACMAEWNITCIGGDQGAHNYLIRLEGFCKMRVFPNEDGPVLTLATRRRPFRFCHSGHLVNASGRIPSVVHQYDRFRCLLRRYAQTYLAPVERLHLLLAEIKRSYSCPRKT